MITAQSLAKNCYKAKCQLDKMKRKAYEFYETIEPYFVAFVMRHIKRGEYSKKTSDKFNEMLYSIGSTEVDIRQQSDNKYTVTVYNYDHDVLLSCDGVVDPFFSITKIHKCLVGYWQTQFKNNLIDEVSLRCMEELAEYLDELQKLMFKFHRINEPYYKYQSLPG